MLKDFLLKIFPSFFHKSKTKLFKLKNKINKKKKVFSFTHSWKSFFDNCTIPGLGIIYGNRPYDKIARTTTFLFLIIASVCCLYQCFNFLLIYLHVPLKTSMIYQPVMELNFPAITFCHTTSMRKSVWGPLFADANKENMKMFFSFITKDSKEADLQEQLATKSCKLYPPPTKNESIQAMTKFFALLSLGNYAESMERTALDTKVTQIKCWWNNEIATCSDEFQTAMIENNGCFVFNQNSTAIAGGNFLFNGKASVIKPIKRSYSSFKNRGFMVLLNAQQNESCGMISERLGAGFNVFLHQPDSQPSLLVKEAIRLHPGYMHTISMKSVKNVMETEFLGRCTSRVPSIVKTDYDEYLQEQCITECLLQHIWKQCQCLTVGIIATDKLAHYLGKNKKEDIFSCNNDMMSVKCAVNMNTDFVSKYNDKTCPKCIRKCVEKTYETTLTVKKFSPQFFRAIQFNFKEDVEYLKRTLVAAEFQFKEMIELTITESPLFTGLDLFLYIGNTAILFWGASTITFYEIVHQIVYSIISHMVAVCSRRVKKKRNVACVVEMKLSKAHA